MYLNNMQNSEERFLEVPQFYTYVHKSNNSLIITLLLMLSQFGIISLMMFILPQLLHVSENKAKI